MKLRKDRDQFAFDLLEGGAGEGLDDIVERAAAEKVPAVLL